MLASIFVIGWSLISCVFVLMCYSYVYVCVGFGSYSFQSELKSVHLKAMIQSEINLGSTLCQLI